MGNCVVFLFADLQARYENAHPPRDSPDDHKPEKSWKYGIVALYAFLVFLQFAATGTVGNIFFFPLVFTTALLMHRRFKRKMEQRELDAAKTRLEDMWRAFGHCFWGGCLLAFVAEEFLSFLLALIIGLGGEFSSSFRHLARGESALSDHRHNPVTHVYVFLNAFLVAGFVEEAVKAIVLQHCMKLYLPYKAYLDRSWSKTVVWMGMAVGLGFGTFEGVLYTCIAGIGAGYAGQIVLLIVRIALAIPFHTVTGYYWGVQLARRDCLKVETTWFWMGIQQVLWHGFYDFVEMEFSLWGNTKLGLLFGLLGLVVGCVILGAAFYLGKYEDKEMMTVPVEEEDRYLSMHQVLSEQDVEDSHDVNRSLIAAALVTDPPAAAPMEPLVSIVN